MADACEEGAFFGERAAVAHDGECVHLQAVVVVESERFVLNHALVELESRCGKAVTAARVAAVQNRHVVLFGHLVDGSKEAREVLFGVDVFFAVGAEQNVLALFEAEAGVIVARFNLREVLVQNFGHGAAGHVRAFLGQAAVSEIAASVFGVGHVHVADNVHDAAVGLFGQALVLAAVASFHVENRIIGKGEDSPSLQPQQAGSYATLSSGTSDASPATPWLNHQQAQRFFAINIFDKYLLFPLKNP